MWSWRLWRVGCLLCTFQWLSVPTWWQQSKAGSFWRRSQCALPLGISLHGSWYIVLINLQSRVNWRCHRYCESSSVDIVLLVQVIDVTKTFKIRFKSRNLVGFWVMAIFWYWSTWAWLEGDFEEEGDDFGDDQQDSIDSWVSFDVKRSMTILRRP